MLLHHICCYTHKNFVFSCISCFTQDICGKLFVEYIYGCKKVKLILDLFQSYEFSKVSLLNTVFKFIGHLIIKRWFQVRMIRKQQ